MLLYIIKHVLALVIN